MDTDMDTDMDQLVATWKLYLARRQMQQDFADAEAAGDALCAAAAQRALDALPTVGALDALQANAHLVDMLSAQRWIALQDAREHGATLEQIGKMLGISRQSAWETFQRKIAEHQRGTASPRSEYGSEYDRRGSEEGRAH